MNLTAADIDDLISNNSFPNSAFNIEQVFCGKKIILYGAGESSHWFVEVVMKGFGYTADLVLDKRFANECSYEGIPAYHPEKVRLSQKQLEQAIVVVCLGNLGLVDEVIDDLKVIGFKNFLPLHQIYPIHNPFSLPEELFEQGQDYFYKNRRQILAAFDLLEDEQSRQVFYAYLKTHIERKPVEIPRRPREEQYFPKDVVLQRGYSRFVSCGAYDGDTLRLLNDIEGYVDEIVCFEADPKIFKRLSIYLRDNKHKLAKNILALPCALYNGEAIVNFTEATGLGSKIDASGSLKVQAVALDDILPSFFPTMVTMDIEGVELQALQGAEQTIRRSVPDLGICVYHSVNQLWEIPLYLHSLDLSYKFYLRNYTSFSLETVLYSTI